VHHTGRVASLSLPISLCSLFLCWLDEPARPALGVCVSCVLRAAWQCRGWHCCCTSELLSYPRIFEKSHKWSEKGLSTNIYPPKSSNNLKCIILKIRMRWHNIYLVWCLSLPFYLDIIDGFKHCILNKMVTIKFLTYSLIVVKFSNQWVSVISDSSFLWYWKLQNIWGYPYLLIWNIYIDPYCALLSVLRLPLKLKTSHGLRVYLWQYITRNCSSFIGIIINWIL